MNDTAQETTTAMAVFVEHEVLGASLLPVEGKNKINCNCTTSHISCTNTLTSEMYIDEAIIYYCRTANYSGSSFNLIWSHKPLYINSFYHTCEQCCTIWYCFSQCASWCWDCWRYHPTLHLGGIWAPPLICTTHWAWYWWSSLLLLTLVGYHWIHGGCVVFTHYTTGNGGNSTVNGTDWGTSVKH